MKGLSLIIRHLTATFCLGGLIVVLFTSCSSDHTSSPVESYRLVRPDLHLGEYLQAQDANHVITVNRTSGTTQGLVRIKLNPSGEDEIQVLDPSAVEARDIHLSSGRIAYRVGQELRMFSSNQVLHLEALQVDRLRSFLWLQESHARIAYDEAKTKSARWIRVSAAGEVLTEGRLPGSVRATLLSPQNRETLVFKAEEGLFVGQFSASEPDKLESIRLVEAGRVGEYASARFFGDDLNIAYFDEDKGVLKRAVCPSGGACRSELVDGVFDQTYLGHDIAIFNDHGRPGIHYLDARALHAKRARLDSEGHWHSEELPIRGAVGFYNQIILEEENAIVIGFHNFRSSSPDNAQTYEDLAILKLSLSN